MALLNIGASNRDDAFYRYKMPRMITKIEGRGNGIKTNIVNMVEVAKALARPPSYITKHFGCDLGAQSKFEEKTGTSLVNGSHETAKLSGLLESFIIKYVQCYGCKNPETEILITKTQMIQLKCAACGFISDVDMRDKLTTFILKNPPETKKGSKDKKAMRRAEKERLKEGEAADEEKKKLKKEVVKKSSAKDATIKSSSKKKTSGSDEDNGLVPRVNTDDNDDSDDGDDIQWQTDTSLEAARRQIQEQLNSVTADMVMLSTEENENENEKKSKTKEGKVHGSPKATSHPNANVENGGNSHEKLVQEAKALIEKGVAANELLSSAMLVGSAQEVMTALYEALCDTNKSYAKEAIKKKKYLAAAVAQSEDSQLLLLRAIEEFCTKSNPVALKEVALVLKALYDEDILEESYIVQWYQEGLAGSRKDSPIWKNVKPFIEWVQSAESESEDE